MYQMTLKNLIKKTTMCKKQVKQLLFLRKPVT